nr:hypothetical protein Iba_chr06bCG9200 [Ipomoea batatas]
MDGPSNLPPPPYCGVGMVTGSTHMATTAVVETEASRKRAKVEPDQGEPMPSGSEPCSTFDSYCGREQVRAVELRLAAGGLSELDIRQRITEEASRVLEERCQKAKELLRASVVDYHSSNQFSLDALEVIRLLYVDATHATRSVFWEPQILSFFSTLGLIVI